MSAAYQASAHPAMAAGQSCRMSMPATMPAMCMAAATSVVIIETGVLASVSLFVLVLAVCTLLLTSLVGLISLSGLTGLLSLVGLTKGLDPGTTQGD